MEIWSHFSCCWTSRPVLKFCNLFVFTWSISFFRTLFLFWAAEMNFTRCLFTSWCCQHPERKLWWKRSLSPAEMRPSPRLLLSRSVFDSPSVGPVSDGDLHPSMMGDSAERPAESRRIDLRLETIQRNRWAEGAGGYLRTAARFKEQNFIKLCHSVFGSGRRGPEERGFTTDELLTGLQQQPPAPEYQSRRSSRRQHQDRSRGWGCRERVQSHAHAGA